MRPGDAAVAAAGQATVGLRRRTPPVLAAPVVEGGRKEGKQPRVVSMGLAGGGVSFYGVFWPMKWMQRLEGVFGKGFASSGSGMFSRFADRNGLAD